MKIAHRNAIETIEKQTERVHNQFNKKTDPPKFEIGDRVYLYDPSDKPGISSKLAQKWTGPYRIINIKGVNADIKEIHGTRELKVHVNRLKLCLATEEVLNQLGNVPLERRKVTFQEPVGIYRYRDRLANKTVSDPVPPISAASQTPSRTHLADQDAPAKGRSHATSGPRTTELPGDTATSSAESNEGEEFQESSGPPPSPKEDASPVGQESRGPYLPQPHQGDDETRRHTRSQGPVAEQPWISRSRI